MFAVDELNINIEYAEYYDPRYKLLEQAFSRANVPFQVVNDGEQVRRFITDFVERRPHIKKIAFSDGLTLYQLGLFDWAEGKFGQENGYQINQPLKRSTTGQFAVFGDQPLGRMNIPHEEWKELDRLFLPDCANPCCQTC